MSESKIKINYGRNFLYLNSIYFFLIKKKRDEIFEILKKIFKFKKSTKILDVGTTPSLDPHENMILNNFKSKKNISCLSNQNLKKLKYQYPLTSFFHGDGRKMRFKKNKFDIVFSSATLEHVGSYQNQSKFINECYRVSKNLIFITTPNRNYPIDFHTKLPFLHLLPKEIHRNILKFFGEKYLSKEKNLNLLSKKDLNEMCHKLNIRNFKIFKVRLFFFVSNLILVIYKKK